MVCCVRCPWWTAAICVLIASPGPRSPAPSRSLPVQVAARNKEQVLSSEQSHKVYKVRAQWTYYPRHSLRTSRPPVDAAATSAAMIGAGPSRPRAPKPIARGVSTCGVTERSCTVKELLSALLSLVWDTTSCDRMDVLLRLCVRSCWRCPDPLEHPGHCHLRKCGLSFREGDWAGQKMTRQLRHYFWATPPHTPCDTLYSVLMPIGC